MVKVKEFYRDNETKEVYYVSKITKDFIFVEHSVRDIAWKYPKGLFAKSFTQLIGKDFERAEILADIIHQLNTKKFRAKPGTYAQILTEKLGSCDLINDIEFLQEKENDLQKLINNPENCCYVCAIGALFISATSIHNKITCAKLNKDQAKITNKYEFNSYNKASKVFTKYLSKWFSEKESRLMEAAFERAPEGDMCINSFINKVDTKFDSRSNLTLAEMYKQCIEEVMLIEIIANTLVNGKFTPKNGLAP